jgi:uncharacterized protein YceK
MPGKTTIPYTSIIMVFISLLIMLVFTGCDNVSSEKDNRPKYISYCEVFRDNNDGTMSEWKVHGKIDTFGPCICWKKRDGTEFCISGKLTINKVKIELPIKKEDKGKSGKDKASGVKNTEHAKK